MYSACMCRLCGYQYRGLSSKVPEPWDQIIYRTERFVVVPTKGALVPGWLLVIPKVHVLSLSELGASAAQELDLLVPLLRRRLEDSFGPVNMFEHGAIRPNTNFGCGLDHAHLHLASLPFDLADFVRRRTIWAWQDSSAPWHRGPSASPYLAMESRSAVWLKALPPQLPRQFFRRIIAERLGAPDSYDYDRFPQRMNSTLCVTRLSRTENASA